MKSLSSASLLLAVLCRARKTELSKRGLRTSIHSRCSMWTEIRLTPIRTASEKFVELRLKTDRDLKALVDKALNRADQVLGRGEREQAEITYARAVAWLTLVRALPAKERQQLEHRVGRLRAELDQAALRKRLAS